MTTTGSTTKTDNCFGNTLAEYYCDNGDVQNVNYPCLNGCDDGACIASSSETRITNNPSTQQSPAIYGNRMVYADNRDGNWDIYVYDLTTKTEKKLTSYLDQQNPAM